MKFFLPSLLIFCSLNSITVISQNNYNKDIVSFIAKKRAYNAKFGVGYRIQLYNGSEKRARSVRTRFRIKFPEVYNHLSYEQPDWKVQVGNYKTRLEADKALNIFQEEFSAIVINPAGK